MLQEIADQEPNPKLRFKIIEKGGQTIERAVMKPNPIGSEGCDKSDCIVCKENGKNCHKGNVYYTMACKVEGCDAGYDADLSNTTFFTPIPIPNISKEALTIPNTNTNFLMSP